MASEQKKNLEGSIRRQILNVILFTKGSKENYENLSKDSQCPARDLEKGLPIRKQKCYTVIPRLTKIIRSGITFVSRNVISHRFL